MLTSSGLAVFAKSPRISSVRVTDAAPSSLNAKLSELNSHIERTDEEKAGLQKMIQGLNEFNGNQNTEINKLKEQNLIDYDDILLYSVKLLEENPNSNFDGGFRVFKVDDSNMEDVYYSAGEYSQGLLTKLNSNIKK